MAKVMRGTTTEGLHYKKVRGPVQTVWTKVIRSTVTFDPPSVAAGAGSVSSALTVTGAALGDRVEVFPPYNVEGMIVGGCVSAEDTILISLFNPTAAAIDLASGDWIVNVITP